MTVEDLLVADKFQNVVVDHVSFDVRAGEIVGIAGVQGNGQTELVEAITGLQKNCRWKSHLSRPGHHKIFTRDRSLKWDLRMSLKIDRRMGWYYPSLLQKTLFFVLIIISHFPRA